MQFKGKPFEKKGRKASGLRGNLRQHSCLICWGRKMVTMTHYQKATEKQLDREWVLLMKKAKEMGISKREIRKFIDVERPSI